MSNRPPSKLDDFFEPPDDGPTIAVLRAVRSLHLSANPQDCSHGEVRKPLTFNHQSERPDRGGIFAEEIFGPIEDYRCACGRYEGEEYIRETCESCGVTVDSKETRNWRFGHVETGPLLHPSCAPAVAEILSLTDEELSRVIAGDAGLVDGELVTDIVDYESSGLGGLQKAVENAPTGPWHERLRENDFQVGELFIHSVPAPPAGDRQLVFDEDDLRATFPSNGTVNDAMVALVYRAQRRHQMRELGAPPVLNVNEDRDIQNVFERLIEAVRLGNRPNVWERLPDAPELPIIHHEIEYEEVVSWAGETFALLWLSDEELLEQRGRQLRLRDIESGDVTLELEVPPMPLRSIHDDLLVFGHEPGAYTVLDDEKSLHGLAVFDLVAREFLDMVPAGVPLYSVVNDQPEDLFLVDLRHDRTIGLSIDSDRPQLGGYSRDAAYALAHGGEDGGLILELHTGLTLEKLDRLEFEIHARFLLSGDRVVDAPVEDRYFEGPAAVHLGRDDRWHWLSAHGAVGGGDEVSYRLGFDWWAAAFSPNGDQLAVWVVDSNEILVLDATCPRVLNRLQGLPGV